MANRLLAGETGFVNYSASDGRAGRAFFAPIGYDLFVSRFGSVTNITAKIEQMGLITLVTLIITTLLACSIAFMIIRSMNVK